MTLINNVDINTLSANGINTLYEIFENDFITNQTCLKKGSESFPIDVKHLETCPCPFGGSSKPEKFWHVITRDKKKSSKSNNPCPDVKEKKRSYDKSRAKRIHWIKICIDTWQTNSKLVFFYQNRTNRENNLVIWNKEGKFLVIIKKIGTDISKYLVSSFIVHDDEKFENQFKAYWDAAPTGIEWF